MTMIIATFIIIIFSILFFYLFANILIPLIIDIPVTIKLGKHKIIKHKPAVKRYIKIILVGSAISVCILAVVYCLFTKYSFGFCISIFIGAFLALLAVLWKMILLRQGDNYYTWLNFYIGENKRYLKIVDVEVIADALGKKR